MGFLERVLTFPGRRKPKPATAPDFRKWVVSSCTVPFLRINPLVPKRNNETLYICAKVNDSDSHQNEIMRKHFRHKHASTPMHCRERSPVNVIPAEMYGSEWVSNLTSSPHLPRSTQIPLSIAQLALSHALLRSLKILTAIRGHNSAGTSDALTPRSGRFILLKSEKSLYFGIESKRTFPAI